jgi:UDPglucose 6-dehydrogenase
MPRTLGIVGTGYVGLVTGTCFAESGNRVICVDIDERKVQELRQGKMPIFEPGLDHILERNIKNGRLTFTTNLEEAVVASSVLFLCLPTPPDEDGSADLQYVLGVARDAARIIKEKDIKDFKVFVNKSTVPVQTAEKVTSIVRETAPDYPIAVVSNPEFLREGFAVEDFMKPDRIVVGASDERAIDIMRDLYEPFVRSGNPIFFMDEKSAEITKYAANCYLAMRISFMNELSHYCEKVGADIEQIRMGIGSDSRIGKRFLFAGLGYGGSCFPKDVKALIHSTDAAGATLGLVKAAEEANYHQSERFFTKILTRFDSLEGKRFALWGLAFKPNTDDTREAPAFRLIERLLSAGAAVTAYDPEAMENTKHVFGDRIRYANDSTDCLKGADALIIATEWNEFRSPDFEVLKKSLTMPIIFDGRNLFDPDDIAKTGLEYYSIGRKAITQS